MQRNKTIKPSKPKNLEWVAADCLVALLEGKTLNHAKFKTMLANTNSLSLYAAISILRNEYYIPIDSVRERAGCACSYKMARPEIRRYKNRSLRQQQYNEVKQRVTEKRMRRSTNTLTKQLTLLEKDPKLRKCVGKLLQSELRIVPKKINALLSKRKGVNKHQNRGTNPVASKGY